MFAAFCIICISLTFYIIYKSVVKNRLTPEEEELLKVANNNQITDERIKMQFIKKEITLEQAKKSQEEKIKEVKRKAKAKAEREAKLKAEREAKAKAEREAKAKAERAIIEKLTSANNRTYFCSSLVNTESSLYLINPETNNLLESSKTDLSTLYKEGWRLIDVDKTGRSAQLEAFNTVVRLERSV